MTTNTNSNNPIWKTFDLEHNLIKEYKYWMLLIRQKNVKLGSCVAILKRDAFPLSQVTAEEMAEYALIAQEVESALKNAFGAYLVHHMALMFIDKHVHFHIIPRYKQPIEFADRQWEDDNIPDPLVQKGQDLPQSVLAEIRDRIKDLL